MVIWMPLGETRTDLSRDQVHAFVRAQFGSGLRRAGISAEFTLATAAAAWAASTPPRKPPASP